MSVARAFTPTGVVTFAFDLRPQLMQQLFGESSDARASLAAAYGDPMGESPLRDLALRAPGALRPASFEGDAFATAVGATGERAADGGFDLAQALRNRILQTDVHFAAPSQAAPDAVPSAESAVPAAAQTFTAGAYEPATVAQVSPQSVAFSFAPAATGSTVPAASALAFGGSARPAGAAGTSSLIPAAAHVGPLQFTTHVESASVAAPSLSMNDNAYGAGASFNVRAGARNVNVDLSSNYERLTRNDAGTFGSAAGAASSWQLPNADAPLVVPNYADLSKVSVGAALAVPVVNGLTLNLNYAADRMFGGYGMPGLTNLDATDNSYGGQLTFQIPHSSSTLSISARQLRYQDNLVPANTSTQTREDVNFTVKF
ncbi:MAG: hypothetical protein JOY69_08100 [Candidatus Eremiobacteraeota bacterium]|nr:hypothetical protein [Candidatus Eremiobacteraeota bacterium]